MVLRVSWEKTNPPPPFFNEPHILNLMNLGMDFFLTLRNENLISIVRDLSYDFIYRSWHRTEYVTECDKKISLKIVLILKQLMLSV